MSEPDPVAVNRDHAVPFGGLDQPSGGHLIGAQGELHELDRGIGQRGDRQQGLPHIGRNPVDPGLNKLSQRARQRPYQLSRTVARCPPRELEGVERVTARHLLDPRQDGPWERPPGSFAKHLMQGAQA